MKPELLSAKSREWLARFEADWERARRDFERERKWAIWRAQIRAALRNPFVFLGFCAATAIAAAALFVWVMS